VETRRVENQGAGRSALSCSLYTGAAGKEQAKGISRAIIFFCHHFLQAKNDWGHYDGMIFLGPEPVDLKPEAPDGPAARMKDA